MSSADLIKICVASAVVGAALTAAAQILWAIIRRVRADRERRDHYVGGRTIYRG